jgi:hypothetical protein
MDMIGYQVKDATEEIVEEEAHKQVELHKKVQDQLMKIQQILETVCITP